MSMGRYVTAYVVTMEPGSREPRHSEIQPD